MTRRLFASLILIGQLFAIAAWARGGGGCVAEGSLVDTPSGPVAVERLAVGDPVYSWTNSQSRRIVTHVIATTRYDADHLIEIRAGSHILRVTDEHPILLVDGELKVASAIRPGDTLEGGARVTAAQRIAGSARVFNLLTEWPNTYRASGFEVHNKGCFLPDTPVQMADGSERAISEVRAGDLVQAFALDGSPVNAEVLETYSLEVPDYYEIQADTGDRVRVTAEHPFYVGGGSFRQVERLRVGDEVFLFRKGLEPSRVTGIRHVPLSTRVYNLHTDAPNTFVAAGFAVHNKGGGGGHGGLGGFGGFGGLGGYRGFTRSRYYRRGIYYSSCTAESDPQARADCERRKSADNWFLFAGLAVTFGLPLLAFVWHARKNGGRGLGAAGGELDHLYPLGEVRKRSEPVTERLRELSGRHPELEPGQLEACARKAFLTLQACWEKRDYAGMAPLATGALRSEHEEQIRSMIRNREINRIERPEIEFLGFVHYRWVSAGGGEGSTVSALIQASARDTFVDESGNFLRGDSERHSFQEFWTFELRKGRWLLSDIQQSRESTLLSEACFEDDRVAGPATSGPKPASVSQVETEMASAAEADPSWDPTALKQLARRLGLAVILSYEHGNTELLREDSTPELIAKLEAEMKAEIAAGDSFECRNAAVRHVRLNWVRRKLVGSEFSAVVTLNGQRFQMKGGKIVSQDADVVSFDRLLWFRKVGDRFLLNDVTC